VNRKIADIEWLRGVSILFVVIFHARPVLIPWPEPLWDHIAVNYVDFMSGVDIFLAVSGFVIARTLLPQLAAAHDATGFLRIALAFWVRRAWRLLPAAWLWLAIILVCAAIFNRSGAFQSFHTNFEATLAAMLSIANYRFGISWFRFDYGASTPPCPSPPTCCAAASPGCSSCCSPRCSACRRPSWYACSASIRSSWACCWPWPATHLPGR
jgi:peptidoglycan/LPS O-acetylase OafA/YrhL